MGNMSGDYGSHYTLWASITENSYSVANNTSNVTVRLYLTFDGSSYYAYTNYTTYGEIKVNRWSDSEYASLGTLSIGSISFSSGVAKDLLLAEWTENISHNSDGKKTLSVQCSWNTDTTRIGSGSCTASKELTSIPRYTTVTNSLRGRTVNSISINWSTTDARNYTQYSLNGGAWTDAGDTVASDNKSGYYTISNLSPNTTYTVKTRCRRTDSGLWSEASTLSVTTYDIARISTLNSFEHGSNPTVAITNPASISSLSLVMKVGDSQILSRTVKAGNNTITFSDTELDNLYKKYGSSNSLTATFVLSGSGYTNSKTCTVTLKGNQKTMRTNVSNAWKRGKLWTNVNGTWKRGVLWINVSGTWKRGI